MNVALVPICFKMKPSEVLGLWNIFTKTKAFYCILPKSFPLSLTSLFLFSENYRKIASENHKAPILWPLAFHFCKKVLATGFTFLLDCCLFTIIFSAKIHIYKTIKYYKFYTHCHLSAVRSLRAWHRTARWPPSHGTDSSEAEAEAGGCIDWGGLIIKAEISNAVN